MINTFAQIDYLASAGHSAWHRASAIAKLILTASFVTLAVVTPSWGVLIVLLVTTLVMCATARVPGRLVAAAASTPLLFSFIFVSAHFRTDWDEPLILFARPMVASLTAVWLVSTTPYPDLFAPLTRLLPRGVGDSLFLTYRAVFALFSRTERMWSALRLRGAMARPARERFAVLGEAVGTVVLSGFDRSQRLYQAMQLRGHSGRICGCRHYLEFTRDDFWVLLTLTWAAVASVILWHLRPE
ncbi:MAG: CbiQ family ECF transporter T component [Candidatus Eisenbacteria bacterium]